MVKILKNKLQNSAQLIRPECFRKVHIQESVDCAAHSGWGILPSVHDVMLHDSDECVHDYSE